MWIASTFGFISIVQHWDQTDTFLVRARLKKDLQLLFDDKRILEIPSADYRYRVLVKKQEMADVLVKMIKDIDYPNFKNEIASLPEQRDKLSAYHEIWGLMKDHSEQLK
ncbi:hypothetical protein P872_20990 [Rhodonellum psychrophilum GCM71 = DSM 17998]|uniref:Uncharacterized protein n=2 Tax=Rhodonellum TaxID=336827 RepID=U5BXZ7_9BACT|nr:MULTISPECIES: hypothetical protein [Rhodonellum]ERM80782.1 hypothetical protein P872_20990 [Rhodonellum psychrophilum GCM71 = DSM 17998]MDO9553597.1 hypothetical protein [Rhodonellum sp.]SDZ44788.1 hypothetical protein SAMN05444412_11522 [Rhodonellum ikkaensis]